MVNELSGRVLNQAIQIVNEKLQSSIDDQVVEKWSEMISARTSLFPHLIKKVMKMSILHDYYRIYLQHEIGVLKVGGLKEKFGVDDYPRYVKLPF